MEKLKITVVIAFMVCMSGLIIFNANVYFMRTFNKPCLCEPKSAFPPMPSVQPIIKDTYDHEFACRVFLGCLLTHRGTERRHYLGFDPDTKGTVEYKERSLKFDGIELLEILKENCSLGVTCYRTTVNAKDKQTPSQIVLAAIKCLGKNGKLKAYTSCYIYPRSCELWDSSQKDDKDYVTLTLKPAKRGGLSNHNND